MVKNRSLSQAVVWTFDSFAPTVSLPSNTIVGTARKEKIVMQSSSPFEVYRCEEDIA